LLNDERLHRRRNVVNKDTLGFSSQGPMAGIVKRNIEALLARAKEEEEKKSFQDKIADAITRFTGSMAFVYLHLIVFGAWIVINLGWTPLPKFDETFVVLAMVASVEAIFLSTFVLITQNRMAAMADKQAHLDLQISLLAEHEVTRLITLTSQIAEKMGIDATRDPGLAELEQDVAPEKVLDEIEDTKQKFEEEGNRLTST
jgi:uncharacterized membrane protein